MPTIRSTESTYVRTQRVKYAVPTPTSGRRIILTMTTPIVDGQCTYDGPDWVHKHVPRPSCDMTRTVMSETTYVAPNIYICISIPIHIWSGKWPTLDDGSALLGVAEKSDRLSSWE